MPNCNRELVAAACDRPTGDTNTTALIGSAFFWPVQLAASLATQGLDLAAIAWEVARTEYMSAMQLADASLLLGDAIALEYGKALPSSKRVESGAVMVVGSGGVGGFLHVHTQVVGGMDHQAHAAVAHRLSPCSGMFGVMIWRFNTVPSEGRRQA